MSSKGFTLIETLVGIAVFLVVSVAAYQAYVSLFVLTSNNQYKILALNLVNEQFEIVRNMPYSDIGIVGGLPVGKIPYQQSLSRGGVTFTVTAMVRNIDVPYDGTIGGTPNDSSPADNKLVAFVITCSSCTRFTPITLTTTVAPKNLETASTNGALSITVFDANGVPVKDADVTIVNSKATTTITIHDVTDVNGKLQVVDAPPGTNAYAISVTKSGYSTDRTYPPGAVGNPSPIKPDATVLLQQVTPVSFSIDRLSTVNIHSVNTSCTAIPSMSSTITGSKMIGASVPKYSSTVTTNNQGQLTLDSMEWDTYTITSNDATDEIIGLSPVNQIALNPNTTQTVTMIVATKDPNSLLVTVKDSSTQLPLTDATVTLSKTGYSSSKVTGLGYQTQTDWSGGAGQSTTTDLTMYYADDGNIETFSPAGDVKLKNIFGAYQSNGVLESSIFDAGSAVTFRNLSWLPVDQSVLTGTNPVRFQIATATSTGTSTDWTYRGPDGTTETYYTSSGQAIDDIHNSDQYFRYRLNLSTISSTSTPIISDASVTYTSSCTPPGQVIFNELSTGTYTLTVSKAGYTTYSGTVSVSGAWSEHQVLLGP